jgi:L-lactate dehydrogenase complex protein LldG
VASTVSSARDTILERIRQTSHAVSLPIPRAYDTSGSLDANARIELFAKRVADYQAEVRLIDSNAVSANLQEIVAERGAERLAVPSGLPIAWRPSTAIVGDLLTPLELDDIDGVVSGCTVAIAETGTIVMTSAPGEGPRRLTLVPDLHICIVRSTQIVQTVPEAMRDVAHLVRAERRPITLVSGPSATSDIELSRVEGVHGPRQLAVLVVH